MKWVNLFLLKPMSKPHSKYVDLELSCKFPDYSFLRCLPDTPYIQYHVFSKKKTRHCLLHVINLDETCNQELDYYAKKLTLTTHARHDNLFTCHDILLEDETLYVITEENNFCRLSTLLESSRLHLKQILDIAVQVAAALEYLHANQLLHGHLCAEDIFIDKQKYVKISPAYFSKCLQTLQAEECNSLQNKHADFSDDIYQLGSVILQMSTGYQPEEIARSSWKHLGLNLLLEQITERMIFSTTIENPPTISEVLTQLTEIQSSLYSEKEISSSCAETRRQRLQLTEKWTPMDMEEAPIVEEESTKLFTERYDINSCILFDVSETVFEARDRQWNRKKVWVHLFEKREEADWDWKFNEIALRLEKMNHPNISRTYSGGALQKNAYLSTQCERGERLSDFYKRHYLQPSEIIELTTQLAEGLIYASKFGFYNYHLSSDSIIVYKTQEGNYHYRMITTGYSSILQLTYQGTDHYLDEIKNTETLAPELYKNEPEKFKTTQYVLGSILFKVITDYHPCQNLHFEDAYKLNQARSHYNISEHRKDIPEDYIEFINTLLHPSANRRFPDSKELKRQLDNLALYFPL